VNFFGIRILPRYQYRLELCDGWHRLSMKVRKDRSHGLSAHSLGVLQNDAIQIWAVEGHGIRIECDYARMDRCVAPDCRKNSMGCCRRQGDDRIQVRIILQCFLGHLLFVRDVEGAHLIRNDANLRIVFGQNLGQAARPRHDSADVGVDAQDCDRSLAMQNRGNSLRGDASSHLLIVQDVIKPFAGGNGERRADDDCRNAARDGEQSAVVWKRL